MRYRVLVAILLFVTLILSGCWDLREADRLAFVTTIGIDREAEDTIRLTVQIPLSQNLLPPGFRGGGGGEEVFSIASFYGDSVNSALDRIRTKSSRQLVISQNKSIIIGAEAAQNDMRTILDLLVRDPQAPPQATVMIADEATASEILEMRVATQMLPGLDFVQAAQTAEKYNWTYFIPIWEFHQKMIHESKDAYASLIAIDPRERRYIQAGLAVFSGERMAGKLTPEEAQGFGILANLMKVGQMSFPLPNGEKVTLRNVEAKTRISVAVDSGQPKFRVRTRIKASFTEWTEHKMKVDQEDIRYLQSSMGRILQGELRSVIMKLQSYNADVIDFGEQFRVQHQGLWKRTNWREVYPKAPFSVEVKVRLLSDGIKR